MRVFTTIVAGKVKPVRYQVGYKLGNDVCACVCVYVSYTCIHEKNSAPSYLNSTYISVQNLNLWKLRSFQAVTAYTSQSLYEKDSEISFLRVNSNFSTRGIHQRKSGKGNTCDRAQLYLTYMWTRHEIIFRSSFYSVTTREMGKCEIHPMTYAHNVPYGELFKNVLRPIYIYGWTLSRFLDLNIFVREKIK